MFKINSSRPSKCSEIQSFPPGGSEHPLDPSSNKRSHRERIRSHRERDKIPYELKNSIFNKNGLWQKCLAATLYHIGNSPYHGHYVCAVKDGQSWYTCNDDKIDLGVKLRCNPSINNDMLIPYLLIYEKVIELEVPIQLEIPNVIHSGESTLTTCQNKSANDNLDINDRDVCTMKKKDIRFVVGLLRG